MRELIQDPFYKQIKTYDRCIIDYCLMEDDYPHQGKRSHRNAVLFTMLKVIERDTDYQMETEIRSSAEHGSAVEEKASTWTLDMEKAECHPIDAAAFLHVPEIQRVDNCGNKFYDGEAQKCEDGQIAYWHAFLDPPHGTGPVMENGKKIRKYYAPVDFEIVNRTLFPQGSDGLEVYEWTTDWSDYFDAGHEWWGAACWSVYDKALNRYAVIMVSATD